MNQVSFIREAADTLRKELSWNAIPNPPKIGIVLGSGLGHFTNQLQNQKIVPYSKIPHLKSPSVPGHLGQWVFGLVSSHKKPVLVAQGRVHFFEGYDFATITMSIRIFKELGIERVVLTNAAGSVNPNFKPGDFVLLDDHINFMGQNPLRGPLDEKLGARFVDLSSAYEKDINTSLWNLIAKKHPSIRIQRGVYAAVSGPSYETPAEIQMFHRLGADVVGMSTVPETIVARQCGIKVNAISCVTNLGAGIGKGNLSHQEVTEMGHTMAPKFCTVIEELVGLL